VTVSYKRVPLESFLSLFREGNLLSALAGPLSCEADTETVPLDLQFRSNREAHLYCGGTAILRVSMQTKTPCITLKADAAYLKQTSFPQRFWPLTESGKLFSAQISEYLLHVDVTSSFTDHEGAVQARWMNNQRPTTSGETFPWVSIDREVRLQYSSEPHRSEAVETAEVKLAHQAVSTLARTQGWPAPVPPQKFNKVDQIALSRDAQELVLIELKHQVGAEVLYSPLQLARYTMEWVNALSGPNKSSIVGDINRLAAAKQQIGLLPDAPPLIDSPVIRPIIGFNNPPAADVLDRLPRVWHAIPWVSGHPLLVQPEVWGWPDNGQPHKICDL
jgi:hypothetical protein